MSHNGSDPFGFLAEDEEANGGAIVAFAMRHFLEYLRFWRIQYKEILEVIDNGLPKDDHEANEDRAEQKQ